MAKIKRQENFIIKPFREILVTDPMYLQGENEDLAFQEKPRCCNTGCIIVKEIEDYDKDDDFSYGYYRFSILFAKDEKQLDVYKEDKYYKNTIKRQEELGCDTACFMIGVWDKKGQYHEMEFDTGADGFYGTAIKYKEYYGMRIDIDIDKDMTTYDELVDKLSYLFGFKTDRDLNHIHLPISHLKDDDEMEL